MFCVGAVSVGALAYFSILMTTNGYDKGFAALMIAVSGGCLTVSKFATGELFDRIGTVRATAAIFTMSVTGLLLCCCMPLHIWPLTVVGVVLFGAGITIGSVGISVWSLKLSRPETRAKTTKDFQVGYSIGGFVGDTFPGFLAEACGSYVPSFVIFMLCTAFAGVVVTAVCRRYRK